MRLLQLRSFGIDKVHAEQRSCEEVLSPTAWRLLYRATEKKKPLPHSTPTLYWAYKGLAKLGGWYDSKRTGRVGWERLWDGWFKLKVLIEGYELAKSLEQDL